MKRGLICVSIILTVAATSPGQVPLKSDTAPTARPDRDRPKLIRLSVRPAPEARPALKYLLLPEMLDREPGNAAQLYYLALAQAPAEDKKDLGKQLPDWLKSPPHRLPRKEVRKLLGRYGTSLRYVELAARRDWCRWDLPIRSEGYNLLLPPLSRFRHLAKILALKARLEIAEGTYDQAIRTLQIGFAMARQISEGPTLIADLVGIAIAAIMIEQVQELIDSEGVPNLYWALAHLPRPFIDMTQAMELERSVVYLTFPNLRGVTAAKLTPQQSHQLSEELAKLMALAGGRTNELTAIIAGQGVDDLQRLAGTLYAMKLYPESKRYLISKGRTPEQVQAIPIQQAIAIYLLEEFEQWKDELFKWHALPYWQARESMKKTTSAYKEWARGEGKLNPAAFLLPSLARAHFLEAKLDRQLAALQAIEAVRMYAAAHDARLPARLEEITDVPAPIDPVTGKPFVYKAIGNTFSLTASAPPELEPRHGAVYEVTVGD